jgi:hypothetical protein
MSDTAGYERGEPRDTEAELEEIWRNSGQETDPGWDNQRRNHKELSGKISDVLKERVKEIINEQESNQEKGEQ